MARHVVARLLAVLLISLASAGALAEERSAGVDGLLVAPSRITVGPRERTAAVTLVNRSDSPVTYRIALVNKRMNETGQMSPIVGESEGYLFADRLVRFSPRQVTLGPNEAQKVRLMVRKPSDLAPGEYRSHLQFTPVPDAGTSRLPAMADQSDDEETQIAVVARASLSIPVIVRHGATEASVEVSDFALLPSPAEGENARARFRLNRQGSRSTYGDIRVERLSASGEGAGELIAVLRGVAVYTPNPVRLIEVALSTPGESLSGERLRISYSVPGGAEDSLLAVSEVLLP